MEIILHYALVNELRISIVDRMKSVIFSLFNTSNKTLYLDNFSKNEGKTILFQLSPLRFKIFNFRLTRLHAFISTKNTLLCAQCSC